MLVLWLKLIIYIQNIEYNQFWKCMRVRVTLYRTKNREEGGIHEFGTVQHLIMKSTEWTIVHSFPVLEPTKNLLFSDLPFTKQCSLSCIFPALATKHLSCLGYPESFLSWLPGIFPALATQHLSCLGYPASFLPWLPGIFPALAI